MQVLRKLSHAGVELVISAALMPIAKKLSIKTGTLMWLVRIAVSGMAATPGGATEIMEVIGKDDSLRRIELAQGKLA